MQVGSNNAAGRGSIDSSRVGVIDQYSHAEAKRLFGETSAYPAATDQAQRLAFNPPQRGGNAEFPRSTFDGAVVTHDPARERHEQSQRVFGNFGNAVVRYVRDGNAPGGGSINRDG